MTPTVSSINTEIERLWPVDGAEKWDNPGLISGDPHAAVSHLHLAVDAVADTVYEAVEVGAGMLVVHHPLLLRGVTTVAESTAKGALLSTLIRAGCALVAAHTNADIVETGTSAVLATALGLLDVSPIVRTTVTGGLGRAGTLPEPTTLGRLARRLAEILPATATGVRASGGYDHPISRVALCAGAGDSLLGEPLVLSSDVFITSDLRHHPASESRESSRVAGGPALIDVSHWASEWFWLATAADQLRSALPGVTVTISEIRTDPWDFIVVQ